MRRPAVVISGMRARRSREALVTLPEDFGQDSSRPWRELAGTLDGGRADVDPGRAACPRHASGVACRLPGPASNVEDMVPRFDVIRLA